MGAQMEWQLASQRATVQERRPPWPQSLMPAARALGPSRLFKSKNFSLPQSMGGLSHMATHGPTGHRSVFSH